MAREGRKKGWGGLRRERGKEEKKRLGSVTLERVQRKCSGRECKMTWSMGSIGLGAGSGKSGDGMILVIG